MNYETTLYKREKMIHREIISIDVPEGAKVRLNNVSFERDIVSRIKIFKWQRDSENKDNKESIFVELFIGNLDICTNIYYSDLVIETRSNDRGRVDEYEIREVRNYDYS